MAIDGVPVFNGDDKFLPGKIALGLSDVIVALPEGDPRRADYVRDFRKLARLTVDDANNSWGIYYYLSALNRLRKAGLLTQAVDRLTFAKLRVRLRLAQLRRRRRLHPDRPPEQLLLRGARHRAAAHADGLGGRLRPRRSSSPGCASTT